MRASTGEAPTRARPERGRGPLPRSWKLHEHAARRAGLPRLASLDELARALGLTRAELNWLSDPLRLAARRMAHYRAIARPRSDGRLRVLLAPRPKLLAVQRWILRNLLDPLPVSEHAHGFVRGRSIRTHAQPHVGRALVLQVDLADFFHQFTLRDVVHLFASLGYPLEVARALGRLCTAPIRPGFGLLASELGMRPDELRAALGRTGRSLHPLLPQGAPTSPALANRLCERLDTRLAALAKRFRARYTRYADDLCFSGDAELRRDLRRFLPLLRAVLRESGLELNSRKTRFARAAQRQRVTGLVVNERANVPVNERRLLRAILHNAARTGLAAQNRDGHPDFRAHLAGRIAFVEWANPAQGAPLREALARVV